MTAGPNQSVQATALRAAIQKGLAELKTRMGQGGRRQRQATGNGGRRARQRRVALNRNAQMRSIPRTIVTRPERFLKGAPQTSNTFAVRGQGYYDAFAHMPEALVLGSQVGPCTPIEGFTRFLLPGHEGVKNVKYDKTTGVASDGTTLAVTGLSNNSTLLVVNGGSSDDVVAHSYRLIIDPARNSSGHSTIALGGAAPDVFAKVEKKPYAVTAFHELGPAVFSSSHYEGLENKDGDASHVMGPEGRVENIPLRCSVRIRNITEHFQVGGEVRMMRYNGGICLGHDNPTDNGVNDDDMGVTEFLAICDMMRQSKRAHTMGAEELLVSHQSNTYPADAVRSITFETDKTFAEATRIPSFCTLLILIDDFSVSGSAPNGSISSNYVHTLGMNNTYSVGITAQRAARFLPGTVLHNKAITPNTNPGAHGMHLRGEASKMAPLPVGVKNAMGMGLRMMGRNAGKMAPYFEGAADLIPFL